MSRKACWLNLSTKRGAHFSYPPRDADDREGGDEYQHQAQRQHRVESKLSEQDQPRDTSADKGEKGS